MPAPETSWPGENSDAGQRKKLLSGGIFFQFVRLYNSKRFQEVVKAVSED
jgi:hypothetical protein